MHNLSILNSLPCFPPIGIPPVLGLQTVFLTSSLYHCARSVVKLFSLPSVSTVIAKCRSTLWLCGTSAQASRALSLPPVALICEETFPEIRDKKCVRFTQTLPRTEQNCLFWGKQKRRRYAQLRICGAFHAFCKV